MFSVVLAVAAYQLTRDRLLDDRQATATRQAYVNALAVRRALAVPEPDIPQLLSSLEANGAGLAVVEVGGERFSSSVAVAPGDLPSSLREAVRDGTAGRQRFRANGVPYVAVGVPVAAVDAQYFELTSLDELDETLAALARALTFAALLTTVAGAAVGRYASGRVLDPLRRVARTAGHIGGGNLDTRLDAEGDNDLEPLVHSFNEMVDALRVRIEREARFASDVTHELRTPLAAMAAAVQVARRRRADPEVADQALAALEVRVGQFQRVVLDLLEISRVDAGVASLQCEPVDPRRLVASALEEAGKRDVPMEVEPSVPSPVELDKRRVGQMVMNLVDNAELYAGGVTAIVVSGDDHVLRIAVEDQGPGIADHERSYIFERFARGEAAGQPDSPSGTGLGLALVCEHARLHNGSVSVEDRPGGGTRFVIELPVVRT